MTNRSTTRLPTNPVAPAIAIVRTLAAIALDSRVFSDFAKTRLAELTACSKRTEVVNLPNRALFRVQPSTLDLTVRMAEAGLFPDRVLRSGVRRLLRRRLRESVDGDPGRRAKEQTELFARLAAGPIAISTDAANAQHYEVPAPFFELVLGPRLKYSCCSWDDSTPDLAAAEEAMLELTAQRARLEDGMRILDLGCGWGSFSLWAAERFPNAHVLSVSNSRLQRAFIETRAAARGLGNVEVQSADINRFGTDQRFDRVVSIEMMEHVRNHRALFERIARWLAPGGSAFAHSFCHRSHAYTYEQNDSSDWMAKNFFTGGMMPSESMFGRYQEHLALREQWRVAGDHYHQTCDAWLENLDRNRSAAERVLTDGYGPAARLWLQRWRMFFIACSELFAYRGGSEWFVSHYRWDAR
jgi:cyclopropane-fatty-acyl-phospholipid synthase